jgi:ATP-binding cassette subfamily F protein 3
MRGQNLNLSFGNEVIYDNAEFYIGEKDKTGIVGVNGAGKTTLFKVILGEQELDSGSISIGNARLGYLPQEIDFFDKQKLVWDYLYDARPIRKTQAELEEVYQRQFLFLFQTLYLFCL